MGSKEKYTAQQFISAMPKTGGVISAIAKKVGCNWHTADKYIKGKPTIYRAWMDEKETILDMGEMALFNSVRKEEAWAVKYLLSTQGKRRGYVERQEVTGADGDDLTINFVWKDSGIDSGIG